MQEWKEDAMTDTIAIIDQRSTPRIKVNKPIKISGDVDAQLVNINDGGICFAVSDRITIKRCHLIIPLPSNEIEVDAQIEWSNKIGLSDDFRYGASFIRINNNVRTTIRRYMVSKCFRGLISTIKDKNARKHILEFAKEFRNYLFNLVDLSIALAEKKDILKQLTFLNNEIVRKGEELQKRIANKLVIRKVKDKFRSLASCWAFKSQIIKRGFDKPRGYPGDSDILEVIYDKKMFSPNTDIGYYFDMYFLENPYAEAVRNRKDTLRAILRRILINRKNTTKILNLACGSCREIWELYKTEDDASNVEAEFILLDWDERALDFSKNRLKGICENVKFEFVKEDIMQFVRSTKFFDKHGKQDLIYSVGLADYLPDRMLKKMIKNSFEGLNAGGTFIIAHKDKNIAFSHLPPEWFCDWEFNSRNENDMMALVEGANIGEFSYNIEREKSGQIFFLMLSKNKRC